MTVAETAANSRDWVDYLTALMTPLIATIAVRIAYVQYKTNQQRLRYELFERRFEVYIAANYLLARSLQRGWVDGDDFREYKQSTAGVRFLFSERFKYYLKEQIEDPFLELDTLHSELDGLPQGDERSKNLERQREIKNRLYKELEDLDNTFAHWLQIDN